MINTIPDFFKHHNLTLSHKYLLFKKTFLQMFVFETVVVSYTWNINAFRVAECPHGFLYYKCFQTDTVKSVFWSPAFHRIPTGLSRLYKKWKDILNFSLSYRSHWHNFFWLHFLHASITKFWKERAKWVLWDRGKRDLKYHVPEQFS